MMNPTETEFTPEEEEQLERMIADLIEMWEDIKKIAEALDRLELSEEDVQSTKAAFANYKPIAPEMEQQFKQIAEYRFTDDFREFRSPVIDGQKLAEHCKRLKYTL